MTNSFIELEGVRVHNLRGINLQIRRDALTVICGVSGSGKSSLAFDTVFAEGQRRYVETFSPYARQFLDQIERPDADRIAGIPPSIAIRQNVRGQSSRSTVGTRSEILDHLRVLFAKAGQPWCKSCDLPATRFTPDSAADLLLEIGQGQRAMVTFETGDRCSADELNRRGFVRAIVDHQTQPLQSIAEPNETGFTVVADRIRIDVDARERIAESLEQAFLEGAGRCEVLVENAGDQPDACRRIDGRNWRVIPVSTRLMCRACGREFAESTADSLNFQSPLGACRTCEGTGQVSGMSFAKIVPDPSLSLQQGAIVPWTTPAYRHELDELLELAPDYDIPVNIPFGELGDQHLKLIRAGVPERNFGGLDGFHDWLVRHRYRKGVSVFLNRWRTWLCCLTCHGHRIISDGSEQRLAGQTIITVSKLELSDVREWLAEVFGAMSVELATALSVIIRQLKSRLDYLLDCGLGYLCLDRPMPTLSGGEAQRVVLTAALASGTINMVYVLDEPTAGLHPEDTSRIIASSRRLQQSGNTVIVVEHDRDFILAADEVIEIGPGAGNAGGDVVFHGTPDELLAADTETARHLNQSRGKAFVAASNRPLTEQWITFRDVHAHNIAGLSGRIPLGVLCVISGVSGSGKSSLVVDTLYPALRRRFRQPAEPVAECTVEEVAADKSLTGVELLDQRALPRTRRSVPATMIGCFDEIRRLLSETHEARKRNYKPGMFSFNSSSGGRCEGCEGRGIVTVEMQFLADIHSTCELCAGRRFRSDVLEIRYRDRNIHEILDMTAEEAFTFFNGHRRIQQRLNALRQAGVGYIRLGQPVSTLSGGESQRLRIAALLAGVSLDGDSCSATSGKTQVGDRTLFILDEPSTGLHMKDIAVLMNCLNNLVEIGHSVLVIEHDSEVIRGADYVIEMGPGAGRLGGTIVSER